MEHHLIVVVSLKTIVESVFVLFAILGEVDPLLNLLEDESLGTCDGQNILILAHNLLLGERSLPNDHTDFGDFRLHF